VEESSTLRCCGARKVQLWERDVVLLDDDCDDTWVSKRNSIFLPLCEQESAVSLIIPRFHGRVLRGEV